VSNIQPRVVASTTMKTRVSTYDGEYHYIYNQPNVIYNQPLVIYNYYTNRGDMSTRTISGPIMRGR
jgi:hypothetical protein